MQEISFLVLLPQSNPHEAWHDPLPQLGLRPLLLPPGGHKAVSIQRLWGEERSAWEESDTPYGRHWELCSGR